MARVDKKKKLRPSILDRLIDNDPNNNVEVDPDQHQKLKDLRDSVRRDLENLLNTRFRMLEPDSQFKEIQKSLLNYGLPDLATVNIADKEKRKEFGNHVMNRIGSYSNNFNDIIRHAEIRTPKELEVEVGLTEGNIFQGELTMDQLMFNRPIPGYAQYKTPIKNLYMCGSSTHPGGGVMGAPGANAAREILRDMNKQIESHYI